MGKHLRDSGRGIYVNTFVRVLNRRGLVIPGEYRDTLAKRDSGAAVVVAKGCRVPCLECYATTDTAEIGEHVKLLRIKHPDNKAVEPFLVTLAIDKHGRIKLPEEFMRYAELALGAKVSVIGSFDSFEIWRPSNLEMSLRSSPGRTSALTRVADALGF